MEPIAREIIRFFFQYPTREFSYRELERQTGFSIGTVSTYIKKLVSASLLESRKSANSILVNGNLENPLFIAMKRAYNIEILYTSGLVQYLTETIRPDSLILFGSYSRGEDDERSDVDIASLHGRKAGADLHKFEKVIGRKISLIRIESLESAKKEFVNSLANGIILSGGIEVV